VAAVPLQRHCFAGERVMAREWSEIESILEGAAGLEGDALDAWLAKTPEEVRILLSERTEFGPWAAEIAAQIVRSAPLLKAPCTLGKYRVIRQLAEGGMGAIYEAEDPQLKRKVAIKVLHTAAADRLATEAQTLAGLRHP